MKFRVGVRLLLSAMIVLSMNVCVQADSVVKPFSSGSKSTDAFVSDKSKTAPASGEKLRKYALQIKAAIQSNFYDINRYAGKQCVLRIHIAPDGRILDIKSEGGDPSLCRAAMSAAKKTALPPPPSDIYSVFKKAVLDFRP